MPNKILELEHELPVTRDCHIVVAGGGPAGISAALSAARAGASVTLIELGGALGEFGVKDYFHTFWMRTANLEYWMR